MRQILTHDFWGLQKNMNCAFPLNYQNFLLCLFFLHKLHGDKAKPIKKIVWFSWSVIICVKYARVRVFSDP